MINKYRTHSVYTGLWFKDSLVLPNEAVNALLSHKYTTLLWEEGRKKPPQKTDDNVPRFRPETQDFLPAFDGRLRVTMIIMRCGRHVTDDINDQGTASGLLQVQSSCPW